MAKEKRAPGKKGTIQKAVTVQLTNSLSALKKELGAKKFQKRIKKAAKIMVAGIKKAPVKKVAAKTAKAAPVKKKLPGKASKKK